MNERVLTIKQPWADLIMAGIKDVENRTWPVPSTVGSWTRCVGCGERRRRMPSGGISLHRHDGQHVDVENDGPYPFRLWVHAAKRDDVHGWRKWNDVWALDISDDPEGVDLAQKSLTRGALLGSVTVTGCHPSGGCLIFDGDVSPHVAHCSRWAEPDVYHWTLSDPDPIDEPWALRGRQGLWTLPNGVPGNLTLEVSA